MTNNFQIYLYQNTGEIQDYGSSNDRDQILNDWQQWKLATDLWTEFDELLVLEFRDVVVETYLIPDSQRGN